MGVITLTTDFGLSDHYVGVVKGVILGIYPEAPIVDVCHYVDPCDVLGGALTLAASYAYFPPKTVHLAVVDPGVGSARRAIAAEAGSWLFVAPDNGVLELVFERHAHRVWALHAERFALQPISNTFHGRDVFAPAAALLAKGVAPGELGERIEDFVRLEIPQPREIGNGRRWGQVLKADRFGNLVTNLRPSDLFERFRLTVGNAAIATVRSSYEAAAPGEVFAIEGSSGYIEISVNRASAAQVTGARAGAAVEVVDASGGE